MDLNLGVIEIIVRSTVCPRLCPRQNVHVLLIFLGYLKQIFWESCEKNFTIKSDAELFLMIFIEACINSIELNSDIYKRKIWKVHTARRRTKITED